MVKDGKHVTIGRVAKTKANMLSPLSRHHHQPSNVTFPKDGQKHKLRMVLMMMMLVNGLKEGSKGGRLEAQTELVRTLKFRVYSSSPSATIMLLLQ